VRHFKLNLEYDGTDFAGFQWQHEVRTVQGELEAAILRRTDSAVRITGAGRTDAGVHALGQVVSFGVDTSIPTDRIALALNGVLPSDIAITEAVEVSPEFSARFSASSRVYAYLILSRDMRSALWRRYSGFHPHPLDVSKMQKAANLLLGEQDFSSFTNLLQPGEPTFRHVMRCRVSAHRCFVIVRIEANAFLRGMVRTIVGTLIEVGSGKREPADITAIINSHDRRQAGPSAPPHGLCLLKVRYGERKQYAPKPIEE